MIGGASVQSRRGRAVGLSGRRAMILLATIPTLAFYILWVGFPMIYSFFMSFRNWNPLAASQPYVGLDNYREALFQDRLFWISLKNTFYYTSVTIPLGAIVALFVAVLINSQKRLISFFRTTYFIC